MGRLKKYQNELEKQKIKCLRAKKYYWDNKEDQDDKQRKRDAIKRKNKNVL